MRFTFTDCLLDIDTRRLFRGDQEVHLSPKAFELLRVLVENRPRVLTKTELAERVWQGVFGSGSAPRLTRAGVRMGARAFIGICWRTTSA